LHLKSKDIGKKYLEDRCVIERQQYKKMP